MTAPEPPLRTVTAVRYVTPLREGGSLPALIEADDGRLYVAKLRGAGQGVKALVAELLAGTLAARLELPIPETVLVELPGEIGRHEPDPEIRDLLVASTGTNLGLGYLPSALMFDPLADARLDGTLASRIVAFDILVSNVDRTPRNPNLLWSQGTLWLIDHGAALYWQHQWDGSAARSGHVFGFVREHVLLPFADELVAAAARQEQRLDDETIDRAAALLPGSWLEAPPALASPAEHRHAYAAFLKARLRALRPSIEEALRVRAQRV